MKKCLFFASLAMIVVVNPVSCQCKVLSDMTNTQWAMDEEIVNKNLLNIYYGMERDTVAEMMPYLQRDTLLETIDGIKKHEYDATWTLWYNGDIESSNACTATIGLYVDSVYPCDGVKSHIKEYIDTTIISDLRYYLKDSNDVNFNEIQMVLSAQPKPSQDVTSFVHETFDGLTAILQDRPFSYKIHEFRLCFVAHKIYDKNGLVTYVLQRSFDFNGSCGCCSESLYLTMDKGTGRILGYDDIMGADYDVKKLEKKLEKAYKDVSVWCEHDIDIIMDETEDNCAIIDEGILFYYLPYRIGSGAEGEYFLVIEK